MDDLHTHRQPPNGGRPSYVGLTFLVLDDTMDELEIVRFLVIWWGFASVVFLIRKQITCVKFNFRYI